MLTQLSCVPLGATQRRSDIKLYKKYSYHSSILYVLQIIVTIVGTLFFGNGCKPGINEPSNNPLNAPIDLSIISISDTSLLLRWTNVYGADKYKIERAIEGQQYQEVGEVTIASFLDNGINHINEYSYRVSSIKDTNISGYSSPLTVEYLLSNQLLQTIQIPSSVQLVTLSPDGKIVLTQSTDSTIMLWNTSDFSHLSFTSFQQYRTKIAFTPNSQFLVLGGSTRIDVVRLSDLATIRSVRKDSLYFQDLKITPDGNQIFTCDDKNRIGIWDFNTCNFIKYLDTSSASFTIAINPDGKTMISSNNHAILVWNLLQLALTNSINAPYTYLPVYNHSGSMLSVSGSYSNENGFTDYCAATYRTTDWGVQYIIKDPPWGMAFSPNDSLLLIADRTVIKVVNANTGNIIRTISGYSGLSIQFVGFHPNGKIIYTCWENTIKVWSSNLVDQWCVVF